MSEYTKSGTWEVINFPGRTFSERSHEDRESDLEFKISKDAEQTNVVIFTMHIKRKTLFYIVNLYGFRVNFSNLLFDVEFR